MASCLRRLVPALAFVLVVLGWARLSHAQEPDLVVDTPRREVRTSKLPDQPEAQLLYANVSTFRVNPGGLINLFDLSYRPRLYKSDRDVLKQNFAGFGLATALSPAFSRVGIIGEIQPLTLLQLYYKGWYSQYFGTTDLLASFPSADSDFGPDAIEDRSDQPGTENYAGAGGEIVVGAMLRGIQLGPIAFRNNVKGVYSFYNLREGDRVKYDQLFDLLVPNYGWSIVNDLDAMYVSKFGLLAIARYSYLHSFFLDRHYEDGQRPGDAPNLDIHRLGPMIGYMFKRKPGGRWDTPTLLLSAQWHLKHPYRTGQDVGQGVPQVVLAFQFRGDLLAKHSGKRDKRR